MSALLCGVSRIPLTFADTGNNKRMRQACVSQYVPPGAAIPLPSPSRCTPQFQSGANRSTRLPLPL